jgi:hypothetical protein
MIGHLISTDTDLVNMSYSRMISWSVSQLVTKSFSQ